MRIPYVPTLIIVVMVWGQSSFAETLKDVYLSPDQFKELPDRVKGEMKKLGCQVPQAPFFESENVVQGELAKRGQKDWAAICSVNGRSHIHMFWGGPASCPSELRSSDDRENVWKTPAGNTEYYKGIAVVGEKYIREHYKAYGGPTPPLITHDAINDIFFEQASVVFFCHEGKWIELTGAD
jgi:hypothetical protein